MRKSGQITVFLSLVLLCIFSLMCGLIESARTAGARWYLILAADSAMDSVFSNYHKEVWDKYRLFLLEEGNKGEIGDAWKDYMEPYMENSGWYSMDAEHADAANTYITDQDGELLKKEILDYMRFGIFDDMKDQNSAEVLFKNLKEAGKVNELSKSYCKNTREAVRLERALEEINDSLKRQRDCWERAYDKIEDYNGSGFRREADKLEKETKRIPFLVKAYEKQADKLKGNLKKTNTRLSAESKDISPKILKAIKENTVCYESYINQDGKRRMEIDALPERLEKIRQVMKKAGKRSVEVEKIISDWDDDDEDDDDDDDGPDESELWDSVGEIWNEVDIPQLSYTNGVKDPKKQKILEQVEDVIQNGLLKLILPEGAEVSKGILDETDFPSKTCGKGKKKSTKLLDRFMFEEYCGRFLTCFLSDEDKETKYELEYLVAGDKTDAKNFKQTVTQILKIREGMNLIHILSDSEKRKEASALASTITGATGTVLLSGIVAFFIMSIWALGEAVVDVKLLLEGKKAALVKTRETWNLSLDNLLKIAESGVCTEGKEDQKGPDYLGYIKLLLFIGDSRQQYYRLMDVIQMNICTKQKDFRMAHCIYEAQIEGTVTTKHLFFGGKAPYYSMNVRTEKAY